MSSGLKNVLLGWLVSLLILSPLAVAQDNMSAAEDRVEQLEEPLYTPFIERYVLDEIKQLRVDQAATKNELLQQILDREHKSVDRAVAYATDTVTYFFYLIAAATSVLVLVGWTSIRDIKERVHSLADEEISKLVHEYEHRLASIEKQLTQKTEHIEANREEIELARETQSLWLRAQQEAGIAKKIEIYDQLLGLRSDDCEALTYKADAVLELDEPQWAVNLCRQALLIDPENSHAFYQMGCAYAVMNEPEKSVHYLSESVKRASSYRQQLPDEPLLQSLLDYPPFQDLIGEPVELVE